MDQLTRPKRIILQAFLSGVKLTTAQGNKLGQTVDFRKIVSRLRREGYPIVDYWEYTDGRRYKYYFLDLEQYALQLA